MASFSRSLKSPTYLAPPRRRPAMPGRTFSNSSERSDRSATSDDGVERTASGRTTPTHAYQNRFFGHTTGATSAPAPISMAGPSTEPAPSARDGASYLGTSSRPISIEVPRPPKVNSAPVYTPPEPLSARGDLPGGYFPLHEDPKGRVHRPHPFFHEAKVPKNPPPADEAAASAQLDQLSAPQPQTTSTANMGSSNIPVASYFPTGYQDYALPMGKYYPSNYESTHQKSGRSMSGTSFSSADPRSPGIASPSSPSVMSPSDQHTPETRRQLQLQQYKRDMIAQAARAANDVAAQQNRSGITSTPNSAARGFKGLAGVGFSGTAALHKPSSPRLHPLGSPGPVTPMELESSGGSYLDKGIGNGDIRSTPRKSLTPTTS